MNNRYHFKRQAGLGLIAAIFVITLMALIATGISRMVITNQQGRTQQLISTRAALAAETGIEQLQAQLANGGRCPENQVRLKLEKLPGCHVTLACQSSDNGPSVPTILISSGRCGEGKDQAIQQRKQPVWRPSETTQKP